MIAFPPIALPPDTLPRPLPRRSLAPLMRNTQGDMLVSLLSSALSHDTTFLHANMTYCNNRDRVITMGLELHEKARALHMHRPEFTLLYHDQEAGGAGANKGRRKVRLVAREQRGLRARKHQPP